MQMKPSLNLKNPPENEMKTGFFWLQAEPRIRPVRTGLKPLKGSVCLACGAEGRETLRLEVERLQETILRMHEREERVKQRSAYSHPGGCGGGRGGRTAVLYGLVWHGCCYCFPRVVPHSGPENQNSMLLKFSWLVQSWNTCQGRLINGRIQHLLAAVGLYLSKHSELIKGTVAWI